MFYVFIIFIIHDSFDEYVWYLKLWIALL